jgi:hypothetical protein
MPNVRIFVFCVEHELSYDPFWRMYLVPFHGVLLGTHTTYLLLLCGLFVFLCNKRCLAVGKIHPSLLSHYQKYFPINFSIILMDRICTDLFHFESIF